jgi:hypothetical protein
MSSVLALQTMSTSAPIEPVWSTISYSTCNQTEEVNTYGIDSGTAGDEPGQHDRTGLEHLEPARLPDLRLEYLERNRLHQANRWLTSVRHPGGLAVPDAVSFEYRPLT